MSTDDNDLRTVKCEAYPGLPVQEASWAADRQHVHYHPDTGHRDFCSGRLTATIKKEA